MSEKQSDHGYEYSKPLEPESIRIDPMIQPGPFSRIEPISLHRFDADERRIDASGTHAHACEAPSVKPTLLATYDVHTPPTPLPTPQAHPTPGPLHFNGAASEVTGMELFSRLVCNDVAQQTGAQHFVLKISYEKASPNYVGYFPEGGNPTSGYTRAFVETHDTDEALAHDRDMFTRIEVPGTLHEVRILAGNLMDQWKSYNAHPQNALYYSFTGQPNYNSDGFLPASLKWAGAPDAFIAQITHGPLNVDGSNAEITAIKLGGNAFFNGTASIPGAAHMPSRSQMWGYGPLNHPQQSAIDRITQAVSVAPLDIDYAKHRTQYDVVQGFGKVQNALMDELRKTQDVVGGAADFMKNTFSPEALRADFTAAIKEGLAIGEKRAASPPLHKNAVLWDGKTPHQGTIFAIRDDVLDLKVGKDRYIRYRFDEPFDLHKDHGLKIGQALYIRGDGMLMDPPAQRQRQSHGLGLRHGR